MSPKKGFWSLLISFWSLLINILIKALKSAHAKYVAYVTFIYLTVQLFAIVTGTKIPVVPERLRFPTIIIAIILFSSYIFYKARELFHLIYEQKAEPKDPSKLINVSLGYDDVEFAIYGLTKKLIDDPNFLVKDATGKYDAKRNIIIGVDRGGAIVGGMLAKNLGLAVKTLAINWANPPQTNIEQDPSIGIETSIRALGCLENIEFDNVTNILLVDDAVRKGDAMQAAKIVLNKKLKEIGKSDKIKIEVACILYQQEAKPKIKLPKFAVYQTNKSKRWLPWDKMHFYEEEMRLEERKKEHFEKLCKSIKTELIKEEEEKEEF